MKGWRLHIEGRVQGVGFRPYVAKFSKEHDLKGWVKNTNQGVIIFWGVEKPELEQLTHDFLDHFPPAAIVDEIHFHPAEDTVADSFSISSSTIGDKVAMNLTPDLGICPSCEKELFDPSSRYFHYPFVSCTDCCPRYSV